MSHEHHLRVCPAVLYIMMCKDTLFIEGVTRFHVMFGSGTGIVKNDSIIFLFKDHSTLSFSKKGTGYIVMLYDYKNKSFIDLGYNEYNIDEAHPLHKTIKHLFHGLHQDELTNYDSGLFKCPGMNIDIME